MSMGVSNPKAERGAGWLTSLLALAAPAGYLLVWYLLMGDGCGPVGHSTAGPIFSAAPFVLPCAAAGTLIRLGIARGWRRRKLLRAAATVLITSGMLEVFVFLIEFGAHHCGE
jgi:hypothetical protein